MVQKRGVPAEMRVRAGKDAYLSRIHGADQCVIVVSLTEFGDNMEVLFWESWSFGIRKYPLLPPQALWWTFRAVLKVLCRWCGIWTEALAK